MSFSLALDPLDYDFRIVGGQLQRVVGTDAVADRLRVRLHAYGGEWFLDRRFGLPWYDGDMLGAIAPRRLSPLIRREMLKDPEVEAVLSFTLSRRDRELSLKVSVRTHRGDEIEVDEVWRG
mgnify:CR=1 FL=1